MDYQAFVNEKKALLVSPAGYGKTYTIAECIKFTTGLQLILTHTHAGIASIKEKLKDSCIPSNRYNIETINGFLHKYVNAFYSGEEDIPDQENSDEYYSFIEKKAEDVFKSKTVCHVFNATYSGLFVDEYQDCSMLQHSVVVLLSEIVKTRILGDPLQGIFDFNGRLIDFDRDLTSFTKFPDLQTPFRWYKDGNNRLLGDILKNIRQSLNDREAITITPNQNCGLYVFSVSEGDFENKDSIYRKKIASLIINKKGIPSFESLLIIVPEYKEFIQGKEIRRGGISDRAKIISKIDHSRSLVLLEALDDSKFYSLSKSIDAFIGQKRKIKPIKKLYGFFADLFYKSSPKNRSEIGLNDWFAIAPKIGKSGDYFIKKKKSKENKVMSDQLKELMERLVSQSTHQNMYNLLLFLKNNLNLKIQPRKDLLGSLLKALKDSIRDGTSVYDSMRTHKNFIRKTGRKVAGKCIGTTLLTKGLEFDTVAILDAHQFDCSKHLYVALTRCCKNLVIFTSQTTLPFKAK